MPDQSIVFVVVSDPDPGEISAFLHGKGAVVEPHAGGPELSDFLEMERGMHRVILQKVEIPASDSLYRGRQTP
jgi:hypothetical protein